MTKEQIIDNTILIYEELYKQCTLQKNFVLIIRQTENKWLNDFAAAMTNHYREEEITDKLLIRYFEFQFSRYVGITPPTAKRTHGRNTILLHWLIGKKALKTWHGRDVRKGWLVKLRLRQDFTLQLSKAFKDTNKKDEAQTVANALCEINPTEEAAKKKFYNYPEGLVWCGTINTLYNPVSPLCQGCTHKTACTDLLKQSYPNLYKIRMKHGK